LRDSIAATPWRREDGGSSRSSSDSSSSTDFAGGTSTSSSELSDSSSEFDFEGGGSSKHRKGKERCHRAVGLVYGALPPDARRSQAALFNSGASGGGAG
jgi:hypothetical protein